MFKISNDSEETVGNYTYLYIPRTDVENVTLTFSGCTFNNVDFNNLKQLAKQRSGINTQNLFLPIIVALTSENICLHRRKRTEKSRLNTVLFILLSIP